MGEIFKNGMAWFIGAAISGAISIKLTLSFIQNFFN